MKLFESNFDILYKFFNPLFCFCFIFLFIFNKSGKEYGVSHFKKLKLVIKIFFITRHNYNSILPLFRQFQLINELFRLPKSLNGDVVECGCGSGISTASLSLACSLINRNLIVCDSFKGLPEPGENERFVFLRHTKKWIFWQKGQYASSGGLQCVKDNIKKYGDIKVCSFVEGYFRDTLKNIDTDSIVLIFEDADLVSSVEDCLRYLWPKLQKDCKFYSHEPWSMDVVALFFNKTWWQKELDTAPPGFYNSGGIISGLGYAIKL